MQSWQTDLLNTLLAVSMKPMLRSTNSVSKIRRGVGIGDSILGRLTKVPGTRRTPVCASGTDCQMEWLDVAGIDRQQAPTLLYLPGGAFVMRTPQLHTGLAARICKESAMRALVCYYRLAPEFPFPNALEDAVAAYKLLLSEGVPADQIVLAGDSAGGGLALSLLLWLRDECYPLPAGALLLSPLLDMSETAASRIKNARSDAMLPPPAKRGVNPRALYVGEEDHRHPLISPIYGEYQGLPPLYVQVSDSEMLLDDSLRLARRARHYQVNAEVDIWRGLPHVWSLVPWLPESRAAIRRMAHFIDGLVEH